VQDFDRRGEGLLLRGATVLVHRDRDLGCYRVSYLVTLPDLYVPHRVEIRGKLRCYGSSDDGWVGGAPFDGVEG
jgi:hypothetical protein